jgi:hypothetical protein
MTTGVSGSSEPASKRVDDIIARARLCGGPHRRNDARLGFSQSQSFLKSDKEN